MPAPVQTLVATLIMYSFSVYLDTCALQPQPPPSELTYAARKPLFASQAALDAFRNSNPFHLHVYKDEDKAYRAAVHGWAAMEDVQGKPGFIATAVGANVTWVLPGDLVTKRARFGILHVVHLKSYLHMGVMLVAVTAIPPPAAGQPNQNATARAPTGGSTGGELLLAQLVVDTLWQNKVSEPVVAELRWSSAQVPPGSKLLIRVAVIQPRSADPPRTEHKIKLVELVVY